MTDVLMVYPVKQYVERTNLVHPRTFNLDFVVGEEAKYLGVDPARILKRFKLVNNLLDVYRENGKVYWLCFARGRNKSLPKSGDISSLYEVHPRDEILSAGVTYEELNFQRPAVYPDAQFVLGSIPHLDELMLGGFHEDDCVRRFHLAACNAGVKCQIDSWLTEQGLFGLARSLDHDLYAKLIRSGHLDPVMHEDDPEEMKMLLTEGRFTQEELTL